KLQDADKQPGERGYLLRDRNEANNPGSEETTTDADPGDLDDPVPMEANDDPNRLAELFLEQRYTNPDGVCLRFWRGDWHRWDGSRYRILHDDELRGELWRAIENEFNRLAREERAERAARMAAGGKPRGAEPKARKVTNNLVNNVRSALASLTTVRA